MCKSCSKPQQWHQNTGFDNGHCQNDMFHFPAQKSIISWLVIWLRGDQVELRYKGGGVDLSETVSTQAWVRHANDNTHTHEYYTSPHAVVFCSSHRKHYQQPDLWTSRFKDDRCKFFSVPYLGVKRKIGKLLKNHNPASPRQPSPVKSTRESYRSTGIAGCPW